MLGLRRWRLAFLSPFSSVSISPLSFARIPHIPQYTMRTVLSLLVPFLLLQSLNCRPILRGVDKSLTRKIVNDTETEHQVHPPSSSTVPPLSSLPATVAAVSETPTGAAAAAAAESRITEGEHCKVQFKWVVSRNQRASSVRKEGGREGGKEGACKSCM